MTKILYKKGDEETFNKILSLLLSEIKLKVEKLKASDIYFDLSILQNYVIFFMIITINLKAYPKFINNVFNGPAKFFKQLVKLFSVISKPKKKILLGILNNLFLEEYKMIYFRAERDDALEDLFIKQQTKFSTIYIDMMSYYEDNTYEKMFSLLLSFNVSYDNFFHQEKIKDEDKSAYKLCIAQSVIRAAFSKEKARYLRKDDHDFYEYEFLYRVIEKDMQETRSRFGDEYKTLFRKEDLCDDIIKYMFFIFGNTMIIESFVKPIKKLIDVTKETERDISREDYDFLMSEMISKLTLTIPNVLKILLKLVYINVRKVFTIEEDNFAPLYTLLIFNFIISPRVQNIYNINSMKCAFVRSLNRLIRNTCYNFHFDAKDPLSHFNELIEENNKKLKSFVEGCIMSIDENDEGVKKSLSDLFTEKYLIYPKFLFYWDSQLICSSITGGVDNIIIYEEISKKSSSKNS